MGNVCYSHQLKGQCKGHSEIPSPLYQSINGILLLNTQPSFPKARGQFFVGSLSSITDFTLCFLFLQTLLPPPFDVIHYL